MKPLDTLPKTKTEIQSGTDKDVHPSTLLEERSREISKRLSKETQDRLRALPEVEMVGA